MKIVHIALRELTSLLDSIVGWLVGTTFLLISGLAFFLGAMGYAESSEQIVAQPYLGVTLTYADYLLWPYFSFQALFLTFWLPGVTMRLFSEELRQGTLELLLTSPVSLWEIVLGKFLGAMGFVTLMLLLSSSGLVLLLPWSTVDPMLLLTGSAGVWLVAAAMVAMGMAFSASTPHQVLAFVLTEVMAFSLLLVSALDRFDPTGILGQLALSSHIEDLTRGLLRGSDVGFFVAFVAFFLLATQQRLAARRWS